MTETIAVVTGGTRGIGRAIVEELAGDGHFVFATCRTARRSPRDLESAFPGRVRATLVDASNWTAVEKFRDEVLERGTPFALINSAGMASDALMLQSSIDVFRSGFEANFYSTLNNCMAFMPAMTRVRKGSIVNLGSVASTKAKLGNTSYGCSKAAIERLTLGLALETARFGLRVNCVSPGFVDTDMFDEFAKDDRQSILKAIPARRVLAPREVARFIIDLVNSRASTTGSIFRIGNGENI